MIVLTCFLCNGLAMGINNAYGVIYVRLEERMRIEGDLNAASKACKYNYFHIDKLHMILTESYEKPCCVLYYSNF